MNLYDIALWKHLHVDAKKNVHVVIELPNGDYLYAFTSNGGVSWHNNFTFRARQQKDSLGE